VPHPAVYVAKYFLISRIGKNESKKIHAKALESISSALKFMKMNHHMKGQKFEVRVKQCMFFLNVL